MVDLLDLIRKASAGEFIIADRDSDLAVICEDLSDTVENFYRLRTGPQPRHLRILQVMK